jgi:DNA polymerase elongation subunit (family B)
VKIDGWLLDVAFTEDRATLWIRTPDRGRVKLRDRYNPEFYAAPYGMDAARLRDLLEEHDNIKNISVERRTASIGSPDRVEVVRIRADRFENYHRLHREVERMPSVAETYDADIEHELKYLCNRGLAPLDWVTIKADSHRWIRSIEPSPRGLEVEPPPLRLLLFGMKLHDDEGLILTFDEDLEEEYAFRGATATILRDFLDHFADVDPDIVACKDVDLHDMLNLARLLGLRRFGRVTRDGPELWGGRGHITLSTYGRLSLAGLVERVQYTRLPARLSIEWGAGRAIESRQCYEARRLGILLRNRNGFQPVMTMKELMNRDRGGLIFAPDVGLHVNVGTLDFESMFPNLIVRRNISYENVGSPRGQEGFLVDFTREALERRLYFKHLRRELPQDSQEWRWCNGRQLSLKEILFCTYGYSGCWANRFGNFDTFIEINRQARDNLVWSMNLARREGFRTIYGNNDSLFLRRTGATREDYEGLAASISGHVGLPMALENHFKFLVLLPQKGQRDMGAINRYYGVTFAGDLVCRGIELRRRDTAPYVARVQREAIRALLGWASADEVRSEGVRRALRVVEDACLHLRGGEVPQEDLKVSTALRREPRKYKTRLPHVAAAEALSMTGRRMEAGTLIDYVYVDAGHSNPFRRVRPAAYGIKVDTEKYCQLVREAGRSVLMSFQAQVDDVEAEGRPSTQFLDDFFRG